MEGGSSLSGEQSDGRRVMSRTAHAKRGSQSVALRCSAGRVAIRVMRSRYDACVYLGPTSSRMSRTTKMRSKRERMVDIRSIWSAALFVSSYLSHGDRLCRSSVREERERARQDRARTAPGPRRVARERNHHQRHIVTCRGRDRSTARRMPTPCCMEAKVRRDDAPAEGGVVMQCDVMHCNVM